jgi:hypothetical protein
MAAEVKPQGIHTAPTVPGPARPARQPARKNQHYVIMTVIGLGVLKHLACDSRTYEHILMAAIGFAAVLGHGRAGRGWRIQASRCLGQTPGAGRAARSQDARRVNATGEQAALSCRPDRWGMPPHAGWRGRLYRIFVAAWRSTLGCAGGPGPGASLLW